MRAFQVARALRRHEQLIATGTTLAPTGLEHESFRREFNIILIHFLVDDILRQQLLDQKCDLRVVLHILSLDPRGCQELVKFTLVIFAPRAPQQ